MTARDAMNKRDAKRVAQYHATNPSCRKFVRNDFRSGIWRSHFEADLRAANAPKGREPGRVEIAEIVAFLTEPES